MARMAALSVRWSAVLTLALAVSLLIAACSDVDDRSSSDEPRARTEAGTSTSPLDSATAEPVQMSPVPAAALRRCREAERLASTCPTRLPRAPSGAPLQLTVCHTDEGDCPRWDAVSLQWGAESPNRPEANRPDGRAGVVHVVVYSGDLGGPEGSQTHAESAFPFDWPSTETVLRNGLMKDQRTTALLLGEAEWAGRRGQVVLAPPYGLGGLMGDHIIFRWQSGTGEYALGLHAWEPLIEAVASLRSVVEATNHR